MLIVLVRERMKRNTKEIILLEALKLFAHSGYEGVSVRDIAHQLGIQQSSLYKHYASKEDIFECIVKHMEEECLTRTRQLGIPEGDLSYAARQFGKIPVATMEYIGEMQFRYWTENQYAVAFRRMLSLEQYRNAKMASLYQQFLVEGAVSYLRNLFSQMAEEGVLSKENPKRLAMEFYGPIFLMMTLTDSTMDEEEAVDIVKEHIRGFMERYGLDSRK
ncbi:MAG: TetR/AcrR family transcriptional regulator [Sphaerochaetaceae bacterium]